MNTDKLKYQIGLNLVKGIGPIVARQLISTFGDEENVFKEIASNKNQKLTLPATVSSQIRKGDVLSRAEKEIEFIVKNNIAVFHISSNKYPQRLKHCDDAPTVIFTKGDIDLNRTKVLSVVGTRSVTEEGKENCSKLIEELSSRYPSLVIVSGLAYGVDICAHKSCLDYGLSTVAVIGHGLDRIYPALHRKTAIEMLSNGGLLTEFISGMTPERQNFVKRNRIIAGLSDAVVVVESAEKGGALITAQIASSYNRDVLAFAGRSSDHYSKGCNWLIKKNISAMIEDVDDLEYCLGWESSLKEMSEVQTNLFREFKSANEELIYQSLLKEREIDVNQLCMSTQIPINIASTILLNFEFDGIVKCIPGNKYRLI